MKSIYKTILVVIVFFIAVFTTALVSFAFLGGSIDSDPINVAANIQNQTESDINVTYSVTPLSIYLDRDLLNANDSNNDYSSYIESNETNITMTITFPNTYTNGVKCYYDIIYTPIVPYIKSTGAGALHELTILGNNGIDYLEETTIDNMTTPINLATDEIISTKTSGVSVSWYFKMRFYNLDIEQSSALLQSPTGTLSILTKTCGGQ